MSENNRVREILSAVDAFNATHDAWANDSNAKHPTLAYWSALDQMIEAFESGDLPSECRPLATAVYSLGRERAMFDLSGDLEPHMRYWSAREYLAAEAEKHRTPFVKSFIEPIAVLHKQGVVHEQIARMWGLLNADGSGKSYLVQQELDKPGSVITPDYVHPDEKDVTKKTMVARSDYLALAAKVDATMNQDAENAEEPVCPESSEQLWQQGVALPQAARMLKRSQKDVAADWAKFKGVKDSAQSTADAEPTDSVAPIPEPSTVPVVKENAASERAAGFESWSDDDIRQQAKDYGLPMVGRYSRKKMIARLLKAESDGIEAAGDDVGGDESDADGESTGQLDPSEVASNG